MMSTSGCEQHPAAAGCVQKKAAGTGPAGDSGPPEGEGLRRLRTEIRRDLAAAAGIGRGARMDQEFQAVLREHLARYPLMQPQDCAKLAYQSALGPAHTLAEREQADVTVCGLVFDFEDPQIPKREEISNFRKEVYNRRELENLFPTLINDGYFFGRTLQPARVTKLFRTELLRANVKYCDDRVAVGEDMQLTFPVILDTRKLCVVQNFYPYHYWINNKSITGKYDSGYMDKVRLLNSRLLEISREKNVYDFGPQLRNDFLSMAVLAVKNEIYRNYKAGRRTVTAHVRAICEDPQVQEAIEHHTMDKLSTSIQLYIWLMKHGHYTLCYWLVLIFFKVNYYLGREYKRQ